MYFKNLLLTIFLLFIVSLSFGQIDTTIYVSVEQVPLFPCENKIEDFKERKACAQKKMLEFVYTQIRYPKEAREKLIEGTTVIGFVVEKDGSISNIKILRPIGGGCDEEVIRIVKSMPKWEAGIHKEEKVRVRFTLPVKFKLDISKHIKKEEEPVYGALEMPMFPNDCQGTPIEKRLCANDLFVDFMIKHLEVDSDINSTIVILCNIEKDGSISNIKIKDTTNTQLNEAVIKALATMPKWIPAKYKTKAVKIPINISIDIKSDDSNISIKINDKLEIVESMPIFPNNCEGTYEKRRKCGEIAMLRFIYDNIVYPTEARENGLEGTVVVSFVVEKDGSITDPKIVRAIGGGCDEEVLRLISLMPQNWTPGTQREEPVRVQFNFPVRFRLE